MDYLKVTTDNLFKAIEFQKNGYITPKAVIEKLTKYDYLYVNPPYNGQTR